MLARSSREVGDVVLLSDSGNYIVDQLSEIAILAPLSRHGKPHCGRHVSHEARE